MERHREEIRSLNDAQAKAEKVMFPGKSSPQNRFLVFKEQESLLFRGIFLEISQAGNA